MNGSETQARPKPREIRAAALDTRSGRAHSRTAEGEGKPESAHRPENLGPLARATPVLPSLRLPGAATFWPQLRAGRPRGRLETPMDVQVETTSPCHKKVSIKLSAERIEEAFTKKFNEVNDNVALPGFRPGHAPRQVIEKRFGKKLNDEVRAELIQEIFEELVESKRIEPLRAPDLDVESFTLERDKPFTFEFEVVTKPEFETPAYDGLEVRVPPIKVTADDVEEAVGGLRERLAKLEDVDDEKAKVQEKDVLVVDWKALDGDSVVDRDDGVFYELGRGVLSGYVVKALDKKLEGKTVGTTATDTVEVPVDDEREELRGSELTLKATLKGIKRFVLPDVDEAFFKELDYDDEDELHSEMKKQIRRGRERARDRFAANKLVGDLVEGIEMSLPEDFVSKEMEGWAMRKRMRMQLDEKPEEEIEKAIDAERGDAKSAIELDYKRFFLLERIAEAESIEATQADIHGAAVDMARAYGVSVEQVVQSLQSGERLHEIQMQIRERKVADLIRSKAAIVEDESLLDEASPSDDAKGGASKKKAAKKKASKKK